MFLEPRSKCPTKVCGNPASNTATNLNKVLFNAKITVVLCAKVLGVLVEVELTVQTTTTEQPIRDCRRTSASLSLIGPLW
jgi:hypothetical protein